MPRARLTLPLVLLALCACTPVDRGFGETVRWNNTRQMVNPEGLEPAPDGPLEGGSGARAEVAVDRYEKGTVIQPREQSTAQGTGGSGGSGN